MGKLIKAKLRGVNINYDTDQYSLLIHRGELQYKRRKPGYDKRMADNER